jgi:hypothetical protein
VVGFVEDTEFVAESHSIDLDGASMRTISADDGAFFQTLYDLTARIALRFSQEVMQHHFAGETAFPDLQAIYTCGDNWCEIVARLGNSLSKYVLYLPAEHRQQANRAADAIARALELWRQADRIYLQIQTPAWKNASWFERSRPFISFAIKFVDLFPAEIQGATRTAVELFERGCLHHAEISELNRDLQTIISDERLSASAKLNQAREQISLRSRHLPDTLREAISGAANSVTALNKCLLWVGEALYAFENAEAAENAWALPDALFVLLGDEARAGIASLERIHRHVGALSNAYLVIGNKLSGTGSLPDRIQGLLGFLGSRDGADLRRCLPKPVLVVIDAAHVLMTQYRTAENVYRSFRAIYQSDDSFTAKLDSSLSLIKNNLRSSLPEVALAPFSAVADLLEGLLAASNACRSAPADVRLASVERAIEQFAVAARNPIFAAALPERAAEAVEQALRSCQMLAGQIHALVRLHEQGSFADFMEELFKSDGPTAWLPRSLQPVLDLGRRLAEVAARIHALPLPAYPLDGSAAVRIEWIWQALQNRGSIELLLDHLPPETRHLVNTSLALFEEISDYPAHASVPAQAH